MLECTELIAKMYLIPLRYFGIYIFFPSMSREGQRVGYEVSSY
jgi:hypothetical protein